MQHVVLKEGVGWVLHTEYTDEGRVETEVERTGLKPQVPVVFWIRQYTFAVFLGVAARSVAVWWHYAADSPA